MRRMFGIALAALVAVSALLPGGALASGGERKLFVTSGIEDRVRNEVSLPLYEGRTAYEVLALFSENYDRKPYDIVKDYWRYNAVAARQGVSTGSDSDRVAGGAGRMPANRPQDAGAPFSAPLAP